MKDKIKDFLKRNGYLTFLTILSVGGVTWIAWLFGQIAEMVVGYPFPFSACMIFAFVIGLLVSSIKGIKRIREAKLKQAEKLRQRIEYLRMIFREANIDSKRIVYKVYLDGHTIASLGIDDVKKTGFLQDVLSFFELEVVGAKNTKVTLSKDARSFFDDNSDLFDILKDTKK
ncbi:MAG: hypothetical protein FWD43_03940 [Coriobacteriia bacterium]|nr:hypothetical protein [Coriobacteriia bacterium]